MSLKPVLVTERRGLSIELCITMDRLFITRIMQNSNTNDIENKSEPKVHVNGIEFSLTIKK